MSGSDAGSRRRTALRRKTGETEVLVRLDLDRDPGLGRAEAARVATGIGFLDHLVSSLAYHAGWELELRCSGDIEVDDHHSVEDCALALGEAFARAIARGGAPRRFGWAYAPLDESLARAVVDLSGRPCSAVELGLGSGSLGAMAAENAAHFVASFAAAAKASIHVDVLRGENAHHRAEAAFKALALALEAAANDRETGSRGAGGGGGAGAPSTKGPVSLEELDEEAFEAASRRASAAEGGKA